MSKYNKFELHSFLCTQCGNIAYSLPRQTGHQHKQGHLKVLYCPHCKIENNCVECKNDEDIYNFKLKYSH